MSNTTQGNAVNGYAVNINLTQDEAEQLINIIEHTGEESLLLKSMVLVMKTYLPAPPSPLTIEQRLNRLEREMGI